MRYFERDLRVKITALVSLLMLLALGTSLVVSYVLVNRAITEHIEESMRTEVRMAKNMLDVALERRDSRMRLLAENATLRNPAASPSEKGARLDSFLATWPLARAGGVVLVDPAGNIIYGTGRLGSLGNVSVTPWFENAQAGGITFTFLDNPVELTSIYFEEPMLAVSTPIYSASDQGQPIAYAIFFTNIADIQKAAGAVKIGESGSAFIVSLQKSPRTEPSATVAGTLLGSVPKPTAEDSESLERLFDEMSTAGEQPVQTTVDYGGKTYIVTYVTLTQSGPGIDWSVGIAVDRSEEYATARNLTWALVGLGLIILAGAVLAAVLLGLSITRPVEELAKSAERIGSGDLTTEIVIRTRDQIGTLAAALLRMRDYLRGALGEAGYSSERMSVLAREQSAATEDVFSNIDEIVDSAVVLTRNMESQALKIRKLVEFTERMPEGVRKSGALKEVQDLLEQSEILAEVGAAKAVEIASATQEQRSAARDVASAARRLSEMSAELKEMVERFKV